MTLYHGSLEIVEHPLIREANRPLDFGTGFYTTTSLQQARRWVKLRMEQNNVSHGYINRYEYTPQKGLKTRRFQSANETGPVANDNVYLSFNLYESGIISKRELIRRLKTYKLVDQLLFHTERSLDTLEYVGNKEVRI